MTFKKYIWFVFIFLFIGRYCYSQYNEEITSPVKLMGPRIGCTYITPGETADKLNDKLDVSPFVSQIGWQFETRFFTLPSGFSGLVEGVLLVGGVEQNTFLPSGSFLIGIRNAKGLEFGVGPNLSLTGFSYVLALGVNFHTNNINFPVNFAVVPSDKGVRLTLLFGFNARHE